MPIIVAILGVIIVALGVAYFAFSPAEEAPLPNSVEVTETPTSEVAGDDPLIDPNTDTDEEPLDEGVNGTFTGTGKYQTPARTNLKIDVTLTLTNGFVTAADVVYDDKEAGYSSKYQERFDGVYLDEVIGKKLDDISLSRIGGASLTSGAFNQAVAEIKAQS